VFGCRFPGFNVQCLVNTPISSILIPSFRIAITVRIGIHRRPWTGAQAHADNRILIVKVLISGAGGLIGSAVVEKLRAREHEVLKLVRRLPKDDSELRWDPNDTGFLRDPRLEGLSGAIHLAGESISGIWSAAKKRRIRESRIRGTSLIARSLANLDSPPSRFVSASGIGFYGSTGDREIDEKEGNGKGFLAEVCRDWEAACEPASGAGIRTAISRFGIVMSGEGGALGAMLPPFRMGLGGIAGTGRQYMSWISLEDASRAVVHLLETDSILGPANIVSPCPVTNKEFTRALGRVLNRPVRLPAPAFLLRRLPGGMADETILSSARVIPGVLQNTGFTFEHPRVEEGLSAALE